MAEDARIISIRKIAVSSSPPNAPQLPPARPMREPPQPLPTLNAAQRKNAAPPLSEIPQSRNGQKPKPIPPVVPPNRPALKRSA